MGTEIQVKFMSVRCASCEAEIPVARAQEGDDPEEFFAGMKAAIAEHKAACEKRGEK